MKLVENTPTNVWGIQTPHLLQLQYAGLDYKFPFGFVSSALAIMLAPLIVGWLGALNLTRQRELIMISAVDDYKLAFPHILNILTVDFYIILSRLQKTQTAKYRRNIRKFNSISHSVSRSLIVLFIALPMLLGFIYSLTQLWQVESNTFPFIFYVGIFMIVVMIIQILNIVSQEWIVLYKKEFYE